jgi:hypothetical protein
MNPTTPTTVAALLGADPGDPGGPVDPEETLRQALRQANVATSALSQVGGLGPPAFALFDQRVAEALTGTLAIEIGGLVLAGWAKYVELLAAARRTRETPGHPEDVVLVDHEITSTHQPAVEVIVDGSPVITLVFEVTVSLQLRGVIAVVQDGLLVALRCGDVVAGARLALWDHPLLEREVRCVVGALVRLGAGVPLGVPTQRTAQHP